MFVYIDVMVTVATLRIPSCKWLVLIITNYCKDKFQFICLKMALWYVDGCRMK